MRLLNRPRRLANLGMSSMSRTREAGYPFNLPLLSEHVIQHQRVGNHLLSWLEA